MNFNIIAKYVTSYQRTCRRQTQLKIFLYQPCINWWIYWIILLSRRYHIKPSIQSEEKALSNQRVVKITSGKLFQILIDGFDLIFLVRQRLFCVLSLPSLVDSTVFEFSLTILSILRFDTFQKPF